MGSVFADGVAAVLNSPLASMLLFSDDPPDDAGAEAPAAPLAAAGAANLIASLGVHV